MSSYQDRFEEEVNRIGVTAIANQLGVARNTIYNWMAKANTPMNYLVALHSGLGMDISYVLFNERARSSDTAIHQAVLDAVDLLSLDKKVDGAQLAKAVVKLCQRVAPAIQSPAQAPVYSQTNTGNTGQTTQTGDITVKTPSQARKSK